jgi:hypothetical protein
MGPNQTDGRRTLPSNDFLNTLLTQKLRLPPTELVHRFTAAAIIRKQVASYDVGLRGYRMCMMNAQCVRQDFIVTVLKKNIDPAEEEILKAFSGIKCRCTNNKRLIDRILQYIVY